MKPSDIPPPPDWADVRTFFLAPEAWHEPYALNAEESHHLSRVLRIRTGEEVRILDGQGREGRFRVAGSHRHTVLLERIQDWRYPKPESQVILAAGWTKAVRRGWIFEKAVELEAGALWFWQAERSQFSLPSDKIGRAHV